MQPTSVTVTAAPAASGALPPTFNTMEVSPGCAGVSVAPAVDTLAVGVAEVAKKPDRVTKINNVELRRASGT